MGHAQLRPLDWPLSCCPAGIIEVPSQGVNGVADIQRISPQPFNGSTRTRPTFPCCTSSACLLVAPSLHELSPLWSIAWSDAPPASTMLRPGGQLGLQIAGGYLHNASTDPCHLLRLDCTSWCTSSRPPLPSLPHVSTKEGPYDARLSCLWWLVTRLVDGVYNLYDSTWMDP